MRSSTLANLLAALPKEQLESFDRFLASPYFNRNPTLLQLFRLLQPHHPQFKSESLSKEKIYGQLFPGKRFVIASMRNLMTKLTELIRKFMAQEKFEESPELQDRLLLQQYSKFKVEKGFNDLYKKQMKRLEQGSKMDRFQCLENYENLELLQLTTFTDNKNLPKDHVPQTVENLDRFFVLSKLLLQISLNSRFLLMRENPPLNYFQNDIVSFVKKLADHDKTNYLFLIKLSELQLSPDKKKVEKLIAEYKNIYHFFTKIERSTILRVLHNLLSKIFKERDSKYLKKIFDLYRFGVEKNMIINNNSITESTFINIVICGSQSGYVAWASRFIEENVIYLPVKSQKEIEILTKSMVHFERGNYHQVSKTISKIKLRNSKFGFHFRLLIMKNVVESALMNKEYAKDGLKLYDSIEKYIRRMTFRSPKASLEFINFIKIARKILIDINREGKPNGPALKKMIKPNFAIVSRYWLIQKIKTF